MNEFTAIDILKHPQSADESDLRETVNIAIQALEKQVAKKIKGKRFEIAICPKCESELFETYWAFGGIHYCSNCGQKLDWSDTK